MNQRRAERWLIRVTMMAFLAPWVAEARGLSSSYDARVHRLALPATRLVAAGDWATIDAVAWGSPTTAHPRGTVVVAQAAEQEPSPTVTEWDLANGTLVRSAVLPLPAAQADMRLARAGSALHVFTSRAPAGPLIYARVSTSLETDHVERLGFGERPRVATDGRMVAVLWCGTQEGAPADRGWQLVVLDALGGRLWSANLLRTDVSTFIYGAPLAVVAGHVFVLLPDGAPPSIVEFGANGGTQRVGTLPWNPDDGRLFESAGRLLFTDDCTLATLWPPDDADGQRIPLPGSSDRRRSCAAFEAVADSAGRVVTSRGDVMSPAFVREDHFADPDDATILRPLWVFGTPALLVVESHRGHAWLDWGDIAEPPSSPAQ